jgi:hypothetical protein
MSAHARTLAAPAPRAAAAGQRLSRLAPATVFPTTLVVGPANDQYEQEADRWAEYVMSLRGQDRNRKGRCRHQQSRDLSEEAERVMEAEEDAARFLETTQTLPPL